MKSRAEVAADNTLNSMLENDSDRIELYSDTTENKQTYIYTLSGAVACDTDALAEVPFFTPNDEDDNHDGVYHFTATNSRHAEITVEKSWKYWGDGKAYVTLTPEAWKPVKVRLQRRTRAGNNAWETVPNASLNSGTADVVLNTGNSWKHTYEVVDPYNASGSLYEYRVVELKTGDAVLEEKEGSYYFADDTGGENPTYHEVAEFKVYYDRVPSGGKIAPSPTPVTTAGTTEVSGAVTGGTLETASSNLRGGVSGSYKLTRDFAITAPVTVPAGGLTIDLNGHDLTLSGASAHFVLSNGATLTILDSSAGHRGRLFNTTTLVNVTYGTVEFKGGIIDGTNQASGGVFYLNPTAGDAVLSMTGTATIQNAKATEGGAVYLAAASDTYTATFNMGGGYILNCLATTHGGGVYVGNATGMNSGILNLDGTTNSVVFYGNKVTGSASGDGGGAIYNAGTLTMKGTIDIGDGTYSVSGNHTDSVYLVDNSWTNAPATLAGANPVNWIRILAPLTIAGDGYVDLETGSSGNGYTVAVNASPAYNETEPTNGHISAEDFCLYGKYFINSGAGLTVSGGYDYDAKGNLPLAATAQEGVTDFGDEDHYPKDWPTSSTASGTEYTYVNAKGDSLKVEATPDENKRVYQSERFLIYAKGKTSADTVDWSVTITNQDEPVAAYAVHTYFDESSAQVAYSATNAYPSIAPTLYRRLLSGDDAAKARNDSTLEYKNYDQNTEGWSAYTASAAWTSPLLYARNEEAYYGWRTDLVEDLPARDANNVRYEYRFISGGTIPNYDQGVSSKWYYTGAGTNPGSPIRRLLGGIAAASSSSSYTTNVYRTDITEMPFPQIKKIWQDYKGDTDTSGSKTAYFKLVATNTSDSSTSDVTTLTVTSTEGDGSISVSPESITTGTFAGMTFSASVTSAGTWSISAHNVPAGYTFAYSEVDDASSPLVTVPDETTSGLMTLGGTHYKVTYDNMAKPKTFTNRALVSATVTKSWKRGDSDLAPTPAGSVYFVLKRTTEATPAASPADSSWVDATKADGTAVGEISVTGTASADTNWKAVVNDLPYDDGAGHVYKYCFFEKTGASGTALGNGADYSTQYTVDYGTLTANGYGTSSSGNWTQTVTNRKKLISVKLTKSWQRWNDTLATPAYEEVSNPASNTNLPASIHYKLQSKTSSGSWTDVTRAENYPNTGDLALTDYNELVRAKYVDGITFNNLDMYDDAGNSLSYRFVELGTDKNILPVNVSQGGYYATTADPAADTVNASNSSLYEQMLVNQDKKFSAKATKVFTGTFRSGVKIALFRTATNPTPAADGSWSYVHSNADIKVINAANDLELVKVNLSTHDADGNPYYYKFFELGESNARLADGAVYNGLRVSYSDADTPTAPYDLETTITNRPANIKIDIFKIVSDSYDSSDGSGTGLNGATFTLEKMSGSSVESSWTFTTPGTAGTLGKVRISDAVGTPDISGGLADGSYQLYESIAPNGYALHSGKVTFTVENGAISEISNNYTASGLVEDSLVLVTGVTNKVPKSEVGADGITTYHFVFENTAGTELPSTGQAFGLSRMGFASLGTVLLTAFVALYMYKKKQRYLDEEEQG